MPDYLERLVVVKMCWPACPGVEGSEPDTTHWLHITLEEARAWARCGPLYIQGNFTRVEMNDLLTTYHHTGREIHSFARHMCIVTTNSNGNKGYWLPRSEIENTEPPPARPVKAIIKKSYRGDIFKIRLKRTVGGVEVFLKSQFIEEYFGALSAARGYIESSLGTQAYIIPGALQGTLTEVLDMDVVIQLNAYGGSNGPFDENYNVSLLRTVGIGKGVTIRFNNLPVSKAMLERYARNMQRFVSSLYRYEHQALTIEAGVKAENKTGVTT